MNIRIILFSLVMLLTNATNKRAINRRNYYKKIHEKYIEENKYNMQLIPYYNNSINNYILINNVKKINNTICNQIEKELPYSFIDYNFVSLSSLTKQKIFNKIVEQYNNSNYIINITHKDLFKYYNINCPKKFNITFEYIINILGIVLYFILIY